MTTKEQKLKLEVMLCLFNYLYDYIQDSDWHNLKRNVKRDLRVVRSCVNELLLKTRQVRETSAERMYYYYWMLVFRLGGKHVMNESCLYSVVSQLKEIQKNLDFDLEGEDLLDQISKSELPAGKYKRLLTFDI